MSNVLNPSKRGRDLIFLCALFVSSVTAWGQEPFGGMPRYLQPMRLSDAINNHGDGPDGLNVSADGLTLFWGSVVNSSQTRTEQIWSATRSSLESEWENVHAVGEGVFPGLRNMDPTVTADGLEIVFRTSDVALEYDSTHVDDRLMIASRALTTSPWSEPVELPESINGLTCVNHPSITGDGLELYFASTETCNGRDATIYVTKRSSRDDEWGEPEAVEPLAWTPGISPDGLQLFFIDGDRTDTDLPDGSFSPGNVFVRHRSSRDEEFGPTVELNSPPNITQTSYGGVVGPTVTDDKAFFFTSSRPGAQKQWGGWQTAPAELCDINTDGSCDVNDLGRRSLFRRNLVEGSDGESDIRKYDISGDGLIDAVDLSTWLSSAAETNGFGSAYLLGDANLDGRVEFDDFLALSAGFGGSARDWADGNFNGDQEVGFADFLLLSENFGGNINATVPVPEPNSALLVACAIVGCLLSFRRMSPLGNRHLDVH